MINFIHISDVLLGAEPDKDSQWGMERKKEIYDTFEKVIDHAEKADVDFLLVSGNLFDHKPSEEELEWLDCLFERLKNTVVIYAAGFCDDLGGEPALMTYCFRSCVHVIGRPQIDAPVVLRGGAFRDDQATMALDLLHFKEKKVDIYGVGYFDKKMDSRAIDGVEPLDTSVQNILVACGGDRHRMPVNWAMLRKNKFDYIALGGHQKYSSEIPGKACYPGSPESVSAESLGPHGYIYGELDDGDPRIQFVPVALREYKRLDIPVDNNTRDSELSESLIRLVEKEGQNNIYTIDLVRNKECEKNFDISDQLVKYRILEINGEKFDRSDYSGYVKANKNTEFGKLLEKLDDSEVECSSGAKLAVDMMIDMSGLYSRNNKKMGNDTYADTKKQVRNLLEMQCHVYEDQKEIKEYMAIRKDYAVSKDVLEELNSAWAKERATELDISTLRKHMAELPRQYRRSWIRMGVRAALVPMMVMGVLSILILYSVFDNAGNRTPGWPDERYIYFLVFLLLLATAAYCAGYMLAKHWGRMREDGRCRLDKALETDQIRLSQLIHDREEIHKKRTKLQMMDGRRRDMYAKMNCSEKNLENKLYRLQLMKKALEIISEDDVG